ncbi:MAG: citrate/2-methylcitrate synthase [Gaiellaceae bacterium]
MADQSKGLRGIVVAQSQLCWIDGEKGILIYRGYDINDLAKYSTYGEVAYLLLQGELPASEQLAQFEEERDENRTLPPVVCDLIDHGVRTGASGMEVLRTAVSALSFEDPDKDSNEPDANHRKAVRLIGAIPVITARFHRLRERLAPVEHDASLDWAANFLYMLRGEAATDEEARVFDVAMILHADHELPASTFTARVVAATLSDLHSAVTGAIGALKGPLHGGANERAMRMFEEIGSVDRVETDVKERLARKERISGFGHAVYRTMDPRARILKEYARQLSEEAPADEPNWFAIADRTEEVLHEEKGLHPNVDLYSAVVYRYLGFPTDLFTPLFVMSRVVGWAAHVIEQYADNRIIRPTSEYVGPPRREFPALSRRS